MAMLDPPSRDPLCPLGHAEQLACGLVPDEAAVLTREISDHRLGLAEALELRIAVEGPTQDQDAFESRDSGTFQ
jgi:hypothetical protein